MILPRVLARSLRFWLLLVLILAAFLRFWQLSDLPPGLYHDEAYNGLDALSLVQGKTFPQFYEGWELYAQDAHGDNPPAPTRFPVFFEGNYGREPLHVYLMALSIWLFGATPFAVRAVPAFFGVLAVWTTYLAAKELLMMDVFRLKKRDVCGSTSSENNPLHINLIPLLAAFFLAILVPAIHFSRFGIRAMVFVPIEMLTVFCFWYGYNRSLNADAPRRRITLSFIAAGFFLGLGLYTYAAARLFPLLFVVFVLFWAWHDGVGLRRNVLNVAAMAGVSLLTALPLLLFFWRYPYFFVFRIAFVANKGRGAIEDQPLLTWLFNVGRVIRGLYWQGETHLRHNLPGRPYLDPIQAMFFTVGLLHLLRQKLNPRTVFLLLWLVVMLLPTILSGDAPHFGRMTGAAGVVAIVAAIGLGSLDGILRKLFSTIRKPMADNVLRITVYGLLLTASLFFTVRDYFGRYASHPQLAVDFYVEDWEMGQYAAAQLEGTAVYLTPTQEEMATIFYALADPDAIRSFSGTGSLIPAGYPGQPALYMIRLSTPETLDRLQTFFPTGSISSVWPNAIAFHVPANSARTPGLQLGVGNWAGVIQLVGFNTITDNNRLLVTVAWQSMANVSIDYTAYIHLVAPDGRLVAQQDRPPDGYPTTDWQPGEVIIDTFIIELPSDLASSRYTIQTGFYDLATVTPLDVPVTLETIQLK